MIQPLAHNRPITCGDRGWFGAPKDDTKRHKPKKKNKKFSLKHRHRKRDKNRINRIVADMRRWTKIALKKFLSHRDPDFRLAAARVLAERGIKPQTHTTSTNQSAPPATLEQPVKISDKSTSTRAHSPTVSKPAGTEHAGSGHDTGVADGHKDAPAAGLHAAEPQSREDADPFTGYRAILAKKGFTVWSYPNPSAVPVPFTDGSSGCGTAEHKPQPDALTLAKEHRAENASATAL